MDALLGFSLVAVGYLIIWPVMFGRIFFETAMLKCLDNKEDALATAITWVFITSAFSIPFQVYYGEIKL